MMEMTRTTKNDNLRMGSRIRRAGLVMIWIFGRLTEGTSQEKNNNNKKHATFNLKDWKQLHLHVCCRHMFAGSLNGKVNFKKQQLINHKVHGGNDHKDNLRMVSRISGTGLGNSWKFGRLTEGKFQGKKKNEHASFNFQDWKKKILTNWEKFQQGCVG